MKRPAARAITSLLLTLVLAASVTGSALAAEREAAQKAPPEPIETVKGVKYRMAKTKMADRVTRLDDAAGDPTFADGTPADGAPEWADVAAVYLASTTMPPKLQTKMAKDFPPGVSGAFYGNQAEWEIGDEAIFVAVEMVAKLPRKVAGQQVEIGIGGDAASPLQVGSHLDTRAGVERFSLSGVFSNGAFATGTTDIGGRAPGAAIDYYNTESGVFGYYDAKRATWYLLIPAAADSDAVVVSVRSSTDVGEVLDRLELPGGGHFISLADPAGGWSKKAGLPPLECRSLETFSEQSAVVLADPEGTLIRYTAGMRMSDEAAEAYRSGDADQTEEAADADQADADQADQADEADEAADAADQADAGDEVDDWTALLGPAMEAMGIVPVVLTAVGTGEAPRTVEADLAVSPQQNAVSLTFEAPPGRWSFALADGMELETPAGEPIIDHSSLTGAAGVSTGPGLDGFVSGDLTCVVQGSDPGAGTSAEPAEPTGSATEASTAPESD